jgi:hypothetical protein
MSALLKDVYAKTSQQLQQARQSVPSTEDAAETTSDKLTPSQESPANPDMLVLMGMTELQPKDAEDPKVHRFIAALMDPCVHETFTTWQEMEDTFEMDQPKIARILLSKADKKAVLEASKQQVALRMPSIMNTASKRAELTGEAPLIKQLREFVTEGDAEVKDENKSIERLIMSMAEAAQKASDLRRSKQQEELVHSRGVVIDVASLGSGGVEEG